MKDVNCKQLLFCVLMSLDRFSSKPIDHIDVDKEFFDNIESHIKGYKIEIRDNKRNRSIQLRVVLDNEPIMVVIPDGPKEVE